MPAARQGRCRLPCRLKDGSDVDRLASTPWGRGRWGDAGGSLLNEPLGRAQDLHGDFVHGLVMEGQVRKKARARSDAVVSTVLSRSTEDGSNFQKNYADTTNSAPSPWISPETIVSLERANHVFAASLSV